MSANDGLEAVLVDAVKRWALGPSWRERCSAWPLTAAGGDNVRDDWPQGHPLSRRVGRTITVWCHGDTWCATVLANSKGKVTVVVPRGAVVVEVEPL